MSSQPLLCGQSPLWLQQPGRLGELIYFMGKAGDEEDVLVPPFCVCVLVFACTCVYVCAGAHVSCALCVHMCAQVCVHMHAIHLFVYSCAMCLHILCTCVHVSCMCIICTCTSMHLCTCMHMCVHLCTCLIVCIDVCACTCVHVHTCICVCVCTYACTHICVHAPAHRCMHYTCMCAHMRMHTLSARACVYVCRHACMCVLVHACVWGGPQPITPFLLPILSHLQKMQSLGGPSGAWPLYSDTPGDRHCDCTSVSDREF